MCERYIKWTEATYGLLLLLIVGLAASSVVCTTLRLSQNRLLLVVADLLLDPGCCLLLIRQRNCGLRGSRQHLDLPHRGHCSLWLLLWSGGGDERRESNYERQEEVI